MVASHIHQWHKGKILFPFRFCTIRIGREVEEKKLNEKQNNPPQFHQHP